MIRLHLNIEDSLQFSFFFVWNITQTKYPNSNHISNSLALKMVRGLIMVPQLISMFKTLNKFKVLWLKVVSGGSKHILSSF